MSFDLSANEALYEMRMRRKIIRYALNSKNKNLKDLSRYILSNVYHLNSIYNPKTKRIIRLKKETNIENSNSISRQ